MLQARGDMLPATTRIGVEVAVVALSSIIQRSTAVMGQAVRITVGKGMGAEAVARMSITEVPEASERRVSCISSGTTGGHLIHARSHAPLRSPRIRLPAIPPPYAGLPRMLRSFISTMSDTSALPA